MDLEKMIRPYVRMPWEVWKGQENFKDNDIARNLVFGANAGDYFQKEPTPKHRMMVLKTIAEVMTIALATQSGGVLEERNKFKDLPEEQKEEVRHYLGIDECHTSILRISENNAIIPMLASYVAAAYALTTWTKPYVADFNLIAEVADYAKIEKCQQESDMRCAGLLIITDLQPPTYPNTEAYAFLRNLLSMRERKQRMNMVFHAPVDPLQKIYAKKELPSRLGVVEAYIATFPSQFMITNSLVGQNVHICEVDKQELIWKEQEEQEALKKAEIEELAATEKKEVAAAQKPKNQPEAKVARRRKVKAKQERAEA